MVDCEDALPDTLFDQCIRAFIEHHKKIEIKFTLPVHICHALADTFRKIKRNDFVTETDCARFYSLFDLPHVVITRIDFSDLPVSDAIVRSIMMKYKRYLNEINISRCKNLTQVTMLTINTFFALPLGQADAIASTSEDELESDNHSARSLILGDRVDIQLSRKRPIGFIDDIDSPKKLLIAPDKRIKLKTLVVNYSEFKEFYPPIEYSSFFTPNTYATMKYLDLSQAKIGSGHHLRDFKSLEVLILYDCKMNLNEVLPIICTFKTLKKLDISKRARSLEKPAIPNAYPDSDETHLETLITSLPRLTMLDITGTDLMKGKTANITAFESRISNPFQFLGVFRTRNFGAFRSGLPAIDVAGEANGTHLLTACKYYMNRPVQLKKALKELTIFYRSIAPTGAMNEPSQIFKVIFPIIDLHLNDEKIMLFATHMIYCVIKLNLPSRIFCNRERQLINRAALDVIQRYSENKDILFNCFFPLAIFPEIVYEYLRVSSVALKMCRDNDDRTQSWGVILLNTLACQIESDQKENIGKLNAIPIVLSVIFSKLEQNICDEVLETAWSFIWNITDEAPDNCASFNENKGLDAFERCQDQFGDNNVLRNCMGVLGNVAEVPRLLRFLLNDRYIRRLESLLSSDVDGIESSYNVCGILAHMIALGKNVWLKHNLNCCFTTIKKRMRATIKEWPINSKRNINYRSFKPIAELLESGVDSTAQMWAAWAVTNLTRVYPSRYCSLLTKNGLKELRILADQEDTRRHVRDLVETCLYQYELFASKQSLLGLEHCQYTELDRVKNFQFEAETETNSDMPSDNSI